MLPLFYITTKESVAQLYSAVKNFILLMCIREKFNGTISGSPMKRMPLILSF